MTTLDERKKNRWLMLRKFYELAHGHADDEIIDIWQVGEELGWDRETTETTYDYLQGEGLLKAMTLGGGATITYKGVQQIKKAEEQPQEPTLYFPAFIADIRMPSGKGVSGTTPSATRPATGQSTQPTSSASTVYHTLLTPSKQEILVHRLAVVEKRLEAAEKNLREAHEELRELGTLAAEIFRKE
jgi:hypothetical protein